MTLHFNTLREESTMPDAGEGSFVRALMLHIIKQVNVPKVQVERVVGPILGMFIADVLSAKFQDSIEMISPEFPLRKTSLNDGETCQSTNIDWLLYSNTHDEFVFLELKTTDTTYKQDQAKIYLDVMRRVGESGSRFLIEDLEAIASVSGEYGKYNRILARVQSDPKYATCRQARLVYLAPDVMRRQCAYLGNNATFLSFEELPADIDHEFANEWRVIREHLVQLDTITWRTRRGEHKPFGGSNYRDTCGFPALLTLCREQQDAIVVGFDGGTPKLAAASMEELESRSSYKWDYAEGGVGVKDGRNWISGRRFLEIVKGKPGRSTSAGAC
jgi:hypothetical protein